jgi:hypothetical protein
MAVQFLSRAVEHAVASTSEHSVFIVEPLIELVNALISAGPTLSSSGCQVHIHLVLYALSLLAPGGSTVPSSTCTDTPKAAQPKAAAFLPSTPPSASSSSSGSSPVIQEGPWRMAAGKRLALRSQGMRALASALHYCNRVSDPLRICQHALAMQMLSLRCATHVATLEMRATISALSVAKLFMLSEQGMEALSLVADCPAAPERTWRTLFGRGRPGHSQVYFTPIVPHDSTKERTDLLVRLLACSCSSLKSAALSAGVGQTSP